MKSSSCAESTAGRYQQIADHYDVTMGTVEALLFRARKALQREFLAIAGPDHRLAAFPFFAAMYRSVGTVRARLHDLSSNASPVACAARRRWRPSPGASRSTHDHATAAPVHAPRVVKAEAIQPPAGVRPKATSAAVAPTPSPAVAADTDTAAAEPAVELAHGSAADGKSRAQGDSSTVNVAGSIVSTNFITAAPLLPGTQQSE